jgi:hypothetical protein
VVSQFKMNWLLDVEMRNVVFPLAPMVGEYRVAKGGGAVELKTFGTWLGRGHAPFAKGTGPTAKTVFAFRLPTSFPLLSCKVHFEVTDFPMLNAPELELSPAGESGEKNPVKV